MDYHRTVLCVYEDDHAVEFEFEFLPVRATVSR